MDSTAQQLNDVSGSLESLQGAAKSLAMKAESEDGTADEAWTLYDALRAVRSDVEKIRGDVAE